MKGGNRMKAKECMCSNVYFAKPETTIQEISRLLQKYHVGCIPICDDTNCVCGIITDRDIVLRCVACNKDLNITKASDIMSLNVCTCDENESIERVENKMSKNQVTRIPICDAKNHIVGIITLKDLAKNNKTIGYQNICETVEDVCCDNTKNNG